MGASPVQRSLTNTRGECELNIQDKAKLNRMGCRAAPRTKNERTENNLKLTLSSNGNLGKVRKVARLDRLRVAEGGCEMRDGAPAVAAEHARHWEYASSSETRMSL
jgi:hypothetical protein